jgi:hypothetical protein
MDMQSLTTFFGWCAVLNIGLLVFSTLMMALLKDQAVRIHSSLFGLNPDGLPDKYFDWLANYKIATYIFSIVPWLALKIMS